MTGHAVAFIDTPSPAMMLVACPVSDAAATSGTAEIIGETLFTDWVLAFEATALLLTISAAGAIAWIQDLVARLRSAGVQEITLRLDKGFFSREMVAALEALGVSYVLKVPDHGWVRGRLSSYRDSAKDEAIWSASGTLYGARLLSIQQRTALRAEAGVLELDSYEVQKTAHVLTNVEGIHALTAWRLYNQGARVEQRIEELGQLSVGETAVDDLGGNHLLWAIGALAYQVLHTIRTTALTGRWRVAQPKRLRSWLFRLPAKRTTHARKHYVQLQRREPMRKPLLAALRRIGTGPPLPV